MTDPTDIAPFSFDAPDDGRSPRVGVVLSHGFTGSPGSMRPWAQHLAAAGYSVRLPLLPGHGADWRTTNKSRWQQWYATIDDAYVDLAATCERVFAFGLSMGGTLVTRLAEVRPGSVFAPWRTYSPELTCCLPRPRS
jgi:carboxylesterase